MSANTKFADSFPKEELITETKAVNFDKAFLLSALLSVGSLKRRCSHGSLWLAGQAWLTTGTAQRGCSRDGCCWRNPDYRHWQLVDLRWLVSSPCPSFVCQTCTNQTGKDNLIHLKHWYLIKWLPNAAPVVPLYCAQDVSIRKPDNLKLEIVLKRWRKELTLISVISHRILHQEGENLLINNR